MSPITSTLSNASARGYGLFLPSAAAATAFDSIATSTGTGSSGTITFSSIPGTYQHLQLRCVMRNDNGADTGMGNITIQFNSDTGSNYTRHYIRGDGASVTVDGRASQSSAQSAQSVAGGGTTSNIMGVSIIDIHDYANTSKNKTVRYFDGVDLNGSGRIGLGSGLWMSTSAITSITLTLNSSNFTTTSRISLYGIKG